MKFDYILFDLDGTLFNTKEGIVKCVDYALQSFNIKTENLDDLTKFIGPPLRDSFMEYYNMSPEFAEKAIEKYRERYHTVGVYENEMYDGVEQLLRGLKAAGATVAVATSKPTVFANVVLKQHHIEQYFDLVLGCEFDGTRDKKTEVIDEVLRRLGIGEGEKARTVMVGDRHYDILGAKEFGLHSVGIRLGFAEPGELERCGCDFIADDYAELKKILL